MVVSFLSVFSSYALASRAEELVFVGQDYPPYHWQEKNKVHGLFPEVIQQACHKVKLTCHFKILPFKRGLMEIELGQTDAMMGLVKNPEREIFAMFAPALANSDKSYFGLKRKVRLLNSKKDLDSATVVVVRESSSAKLAQLHKAQFPSLFISEQSDNSTILRMISAGRFGDKALILGNRDVIRYLIKKEGYQKIVELLPVENEDYSIAFSKKKVSSALFEKFNTALNEVKHGKAIKAIFQKYGVSEAS